MVYLRGLFVMSAVAVLLLMLTSDAESAATKVAYKRPIFGKTNAIKEKRSRTRPEIQKKMALTVTTSAPTTTSTTTTELSTATSGVGATTPTAAVPAAATEVTFSETTTPLSLITVHEEQEEEEEEEDHAMAASSSAAALAAAAAAPIAAIMTNASSSRSSRSSEEVQHVTPQDIQFMLLNNKTQNSAEDLPAIHLINNTLENATTLEEEVVDAVDIAGVKDVSIAPAEDDIEQELLPIALELIAPRPTTTSTTGKSSKSSAATAKSNPPVPCTCGVFMTSQIKRGSNEQPQGEPVIMNELDRTYPCNAVGQKQCQTKCLETIVQHLPNSANILCATLNRDCRKERAYLYIKNCQNHWWNTSLTAGREYCCRNGQPYKCPIL